MSKIYCNWMHVLKNDGTVWGCGYNYYGQLGLGNTTSQNSLQQMLTNDVKLLGDLPAENEMKLQLNIIPEKIHNDTILLDGNIKHQNNKKVKYCIKINDEIILDSPNYEINPKINYKIKNESFNNTNNVLLFILTDENDVINEYYYYITLYNNNPTGILQLDKTEMHKGDISLTGTLKDDDLDKISYRILINDKEVLKWNKFEEDPYIDYIINYKQLNLGNNSIKVEFKDDYKLEGLGSWENTITLINKSPKIENLKYENGIISCDINDSDNDLIHYNIYLNDKKIYPIMNDYSDLDALNKIEYRLSRNDILFNEENKIIINVRDEFNAIDSQEINFIGEYYGLMFCDENKEYYTTDIGKLLKYLDFGIITLGQTSEVKKIIMQNKYGLVLKNIELWLKTNLSNVKVQLSKTRYPFIPMENLAYEKEYKPNEEEEFYVRLESNLSMESVSGEFEIFAKGTPIE